MTAKDTFSLLPHLKGIPSWCQHATLQLDGHTIEHLEHVTVCAIKYINFQSN